MCYYQIKVPTRRWLEQLVWEICWSSECARGAECHGTCAHPLECVHSLAASGGMEFGFVLPL